MQFRNEKYFSVYAQIRLYQGLLFFLLCITIISPFKGFCDGGEMTGEEIIIVNRQDNGKEVKAKVGDVMQIELESLGSAGYKWFIENLDVNYLELISEETETIVDKERVGAPVMSIWRFKVLQKGVTDVRMSHYRVWEGKEKATEHFHIKLIIN
jgi:predicted secreted protein